MRLLGDEEAASALTRGLGDVDVLEAEAVEESGDGGAGVFAGGVEDAVGEGGLLELVLGFGAGFGFEVLVYGGRGGRWCGNRRGCARCQGW